MEAAAATQKRREGTASNMTSNNVNNATATTTTTALHASNVSLHVNNATISNKTRSTEVDGVAEKMVETTGLCRIRRHILDLDSLDPKTGFPTKWMSDHSDYDSQATVSDDKGDYTDNSETSNVCAISIKEDWEILRKRLLAEEKEKKVFEAAIPQRNVLVENKSQLKKRIWARILGEKRTK